MAELLIFLEERSSYLEYVFKHVFERMLGWSIAFASSREEVRTTDKPALVHARDPIGRAFHIPLFPLPGQADASDLTGGEPRSVLELAGKLLSGWDHFPTSPHGVDEHGRPIRMAPVLERPLLDERVLWFAERMALELDGLPPVRRTYQHIATLDVDNGFKYLGRPLWRTIGSAGRDLLHGRFGELNDRLATLLGTRLDPYDIYDDFRKLASGNAHRTLVNFLVAPRGPHDHAVGPSHPGMVERIRSVAEWAEVGIHPSYRSSERPELIRQERDLLSQVIGRRVLRSRQHFLRYHHPDTFLELVRLGITEDHSVGFHDAIGFRAGTCTPFPFFDVREDRETDLLIFPFQVMDSAMACRMKLSPDEAIAAAKRVVDNVRTVRGTFIGVWHERFFSDHAAEKGWRRVVEEVIRYAKP